MKRDASNFYYVNYRFFGSEKDEKKKEKKAITIE